MSDAERDEMRELVAWSLRRNEPAWRWEGPDVPRTKAAVGSVRSSVDGAIVVAVNAASVASVDTISSRPPSPDAMPPRRFAAKPTFDMYAEDGTYMGRVALPIGSQLHVIRGMDAWGTISDSLGEQHLVRWRIGS